ncbi:MAG: hypothetical protein QGM46_02910 [Actinomycetota bacterium]|nr:hypothetical protein [Actinomycetota bacterium]MDK1016171.1 hypothetical protein [Actinomycetota bacterium]MDK1026178.1 hypothetical protein [Actinomycetota bacterium]MDK1038702.1 hypothetical protein [Actinomycetota bacterium]MDK1096395.1 hypothetical protein [Actinomycetota bacterium]
MRRQHGTALMEIIIIGFAVMMMVLPVISMVARLTEASGEVHAVARDTAVWVARHGSDPQIGGEVDVRLVERAGTIEVVASRDVQLIGVGGTAISWTVRSRVEIPVSLYRSRP